MTVKSICYNRLRDVEKRQAARGEAVRLVVEQGQQITVIAKKFGISRQTLYKWIGVAENHNGDVPISVGGRTPRLTSQQKEQLCEMIENGPRALGYDFDAWTLGRIAVLINDKFCIVYTSLGYLSVMLRNMGLSSQRPERQARERDENKGEDFRKNKLPEIQKKNR